MSTVIFTKSDAKYMAQALQLAIKGVYTTTPNPCVGCVIVHSDEVIGEGWHVEAGNAHAEINALADACAKGNREKIAGSTVYVTLEPCAHQGKTAPCCEALSEANVARVVYAMQDPNPAVSGLGKQAMIDAGVVVEEGLMAQSAEKINKGFLKRQRQGLPYVTCKVAASLDGATAMASGESQWITSEAARAKVQLFRAASCAVITGVGTILQDDPEFTVRDRSIAGQGDRQPALVIVDSELKTPVAARIFACGVKRRILIVCGRNPDAEKKAQLQSLGAEVVELGVDTKHKERSVDLRAMLSFLAKQAFNEVLLESGAILTGAFLQAQLIDELKLFMAPKLMGSQTKSMFGLPFSHLSQAINLDVCDVGYVGKDLLLEIIPQYDSKSDNE